LANYAHIDIAIALTHDNICKFNESVGHKGRGGEEERGRGGEFKIYNLKFKIQNLKLSGNRDKEIGR